MVFPAVAHRSHTLTKTGARTRVRPVRSSGPRALTLLLVLAAGAMQLGGCATPAMDVSSDFDRNYDFSGVERIALLPIDRTTAAERFISDMQVGRINAALSDELTGRGFVVVEDRAEADLYLAWHLVTREKTDIRSYNAASTYQCWRCGPPVSDVSVYQYTQGSFIVDLIDPNRNRSVWRSTIQSRIEPNPGPDKAAKRRAAAAEAVLAPFPPAAP